MEEMSCGTVDENTSMSSSGMPLVFKDMWRCGCPKKALIGTATSTLRPKTRNPALARHFHEEYVEHNVESLALAVIRQKLSDEVASLSLSS